MDAGEGGIIFFNFQDVTDMGDICQIVTQVSIELKQNKQTKKQKNLEKGMKRNEEHDTERMGETSK